MRIKTDQRIFMRTNEHTKRCLEAAAILSGFNSLSSFILSTIYKEAQKIIKEAESRILTDEDRDIVLEALTNPPLPNRRLKELLFESKNIKISG